MTLATPERIAVIGLGLIGGSIGLAVRNRFPSVVVTGFDPDPSVRSAAIKHGAIGVEAASLSECVAEADLVVLAAPVGALSDTLAEIAPYVQSGSVVIDTGSAKASVEVAARALPHGVRFVGGHPMAGSERGGIENADPLLFENAVFVLCPPAAAANTPIESYAPEAVWLTRALGARAMVMGAARHDEVVAAVSHLPQLLAVALVEHAADVGPDALPLAAGGFRDMTRIASSSFTLWEQIIAANEPAARAALRAFQDRLSEMDDQLGKSSLGDSFERAAATRDAIPTTSKGFLAPIADVVVWAEDRPGYLHRLTGVLSEADLNVKDIELLRIREGEGGAFRLGLADGADADRAVDVLTQAGYRAQRR